jgi:hypothetical protein
LVFTGCPLNPISRGHTVTVAKDKPGTSARIPA